MHAAQREADAPVRLGEPAAVASAKPTAHAPIRADSLLQSDSGDAAQLQQEPSAEKAASGNKYSGPAMDSTEAAPNLSAQPLELSQHTVPAPIMPKVETDSGDSETDVSAYSPIVTEKADKQQVVWARVKGYPSWPVRCITISYINSNLIFQRMLCKFARRWAVAITSLAGYNCRLK